MNSDVTLGAYYQFEWRETRLPAVGSYWSFADFADQGGERLILGEDTFVHHGKDFDGSNSGQGGVQLCVKGDDSEYGLYAAVFHDKMPGFYAYLKDHKADTLTAVVNTVEAFAARVNGKDLQFLDAAGNAGIEAATNIVVRRANVQMLLLVYAAVIVLALITFRSWRAMLCAILPLMLTSVLCEALMVALNIGVKVATLPVIALGVGIGVDYSLYVMTVMLASLRTGQSLSLSYYRALLFTGKVVVLTGLTLGIAVATWVFSPIRFQADMGVLLAFMFIWNMLGALILLPALGHFLLRPAPAADCLSLPPMLMPSSSPAGKVSDDAVSGEVRPV